MPEGHRLRGLQMGKAGHDGGGVGERFLGQRALIGRKLDVDFVDRVAYPKPKIGRHLVVTRTRGVQSAGGRSNQFGEPRLDVHVDVFERALEAKFAAFDL